MRKFLMHFVFWAFFCLMWDRIMYFYMDNRLSRLYFSVMDVALLSSAFYLVYCWVTPYYIRTRSLLKLLLFCAIGLVALAAAYSLLMGLLLQYNTVPVRFVFAWSYADLQYNRVFIALFGIAAGIFIKLAMDRIAVTRKLEKVEQEQTAAELNYLKAQLNPHFLFNALNGLHAQMAIDSHAAQHTLIALSDLLRYQLYECNTDQILLDNEIKHLVNYFELQRIRLEEGEASLHIEGDLSGHAIAPMLLMALVENAFKHVRPVNGRNKLSVELKLETIAGRHILTCCCSNTAMDVAKKKLSIEEGIGLANVKKRLKLLYPGRHTLDAGMKDNIYDAKLVIQL